MMPADAVLISIMICLGGALLTALVSSNKTIAGWLAFLTTAWASFFIYLSIDQVLFGVGAQTKTFFALPQFEIAFRFEIDGLTTVFLGLIATIALFSSFYSIPYMKHYEDYGVGRYYPNFLLFVAGMYGIVSVTDTVIFFFVFWQLMTIPSYLLVRYEYRKAENVRAARKYLWMMQVACLLAMAGSLLLSQGSVAQTSGEFISRFDFEAVRHHLPGLMNGKGLWVVFAFVCFLVGFGIKAGMWPLGQMWLPDAHPAAPSPVSAMLSGVMIKTGIYGILRNFFWLIEADALKSFPAQVWGTVICILGTITLFVGTMQALKQDQTKRLLAFSSIGQIGYVLLAAGITLVLIKTDAKNLATLAMIGALFHVVNHGVFKSLLFLNVGSIDYSTHSRDLNHLGGLMKFMPVTALTTLIAAFSIAGVPLFNGFASKWSIYVAGVMGSEKAPFLVFCSIIAILTGALTLALSLKLFGASFLSRKSAYIKKKTEGKKNLEVGWMMGLPQILLASICINLGFVPLIAYRGFNKILTLSPTGLGEVLSHHRPDLSNGWSLMGGYSVDASFAPLVVASVVLLMFLLVYIVSKLGGSHRRVGEPWLCGYSVEGEENRYKAHHYYFQMKRYFRWLGSNPVRTSAKVCEEKEEKK